jgi:ribosome-associated protein
MMRQTMPSLLLLIPLWLASIASVKAWSLAVGKTPFPRTFRQPSPFTALPAETSQYSAEQYFSWVGDNASDLAKDNGETLELLKTIIKAADGRKAENIVSMYVAPVTTMTRYLVIVSGNSRPQNQAIANAVKKDVEEVFQIRPGSTGVPEGSADSGWMLLDFGSIMVHVMTPKSRIYYNI